MAKYFLNKAGEFQLDKRSLPRVNRLQFAHFFTSLIVCITSYVLVADQLFLLSTSLAVATYISNVLILLANLFFILQLKRDQLPLIKFGFTLKNWKLSTFEALWSTAIILVVLTLIKWKMIQYEPRLYGVTLFHTVSFDKERTALALAYLVGVPLQEIIARGMAYNYFLSVFVGPYYKLQANLCSTCFFVLVHLHGQLLVMLSIIPFSLFWGWLFQRHRTLIGCIISHTLIGFWAFFILDFDHVSALLVT